MPAPGRGRIAGGVSCPGLGARGRGVGRRTSWARHRRDAGAADLGTGRYDTEFPLGDAEMSVSHLRGPAGSTPKSLAKSGARRPCAARVGTVTHPLGQSSTGRICGPSGKSPARQRRPAAPRTPGEIFSLASQRIWRTGRRVALPCPHPWVGLRTPTLHRRVLYPYSSQRRTLRVAGPAHEDLHACVVPHTESAGTRAATGPPVILLRALVPDGVSRRNRPVGGPCSGPR